MLCNNQKHGTKKQAMTVKIKLCDRSIHAFTKLENKHVDMIIIWRANTTNTVESYIKSEPHELTEN